MLEAQRVANLLGEHGNEMVALALAASQVSGRDVLLLALGDRTRSVEFAWFVRQAPSFIAGLRAFADMVEAVSADFTVALHRRPDVQAVQRDAMNHRPHSGPEATPSASAVSMPTPA